MNKIIEKLKTDTDEMKDIIYRKKIISKITTYIVFSESLTNSDKISDFIIRSLNKIKKVNKKNILEKIKNNISNNKVQEITTYQEICKYLHSGFTIIIIDNISTYLALETKGDLSRSIDKPESENTYRGAKDAFTEIYQTNIGLIKRRIKSNKLRIKNYNKGKYTQSEIGVLSLSDKVHKESYNMILKKMENLNIEDIVNSGEIKNNIEKENKSVFPTVRTTERPDIAVLALLSGKTVIVIDNCPYVLILPSCLNDFFKTSEDVYGKSINVTFTRILKLFAFFIALLVPAIYIAIITFNQEMLPTDLLINFSTQRDGVPFPAFFEAILMMICFEILREGDLRVPGFSGSALSIVGALILGDAAVNAGIVSPIMIIVIAITAISSLLFTEPELINALRIWRIFFMIGATIIGIIGVLIVFLILIIHLSSLKSFGVPYLKPFSPINKKELKDSIIKLNSTNGGQNEKN